MPATSADDTALHFTVVLEWDDEGQGWAVSVPALPGCLTQGDTRQEALCNAQEAIAGFLEAMIKAGEPLPDDQKVELAAVTVPAPR